MKTNIALAINAVLVLTLTYFLAKQDAEKERLEAYEYHIELLDQNRIKVYNNENSVVIPADSLDYYLIKDNE